MFGDSMEILHFFETIRTPVLNKLSLFFSLFGNEMLVFAVLCCLYWCVNKRLAYKIAFAFYLSGMAVQSAKIGFRIPPPWLRDPTLTPLPEAMGHTDGFSFPCGVAQSATELFSSVAMYLKKKRVTALCLAIILLSSLSILYQGLHSLTDVLAAMGLALVISGLSYWFFAHYHSDTQHDAIVTIVYSVAAMATVVFAYETMLVGHIDYEYVSTCSKTAGAAIGFAAGWYIERRHIGFHVSTGGRLWQIPKFIIGYAVVLAVEMLAHYSHSVPLDILSYFFLSIWIFLLYPLIIKHIYAKFSHKPNNEEDDKDEDANEI